MESRRPLGIFLLLIAVVSVPIGLKVRTQNLQEQEEIAKDRGVEAQRLQDRNLPTGERLNLEMMRDIRSPGIGYYKKVFAIQRRFRRTKQLSPQDVATIAKGLSGPADVLVKMPGFNTLNEAAKLGKLPPSCRHEVTSACLIGLKSKEILIRQSSASILGNLGDQAALSSLLPLTKDPEFHVRRVVNNALKKLGYSRPTSTVSPRA